MTADEAAIARAVAALRAGGLVAFPTETVYGLGAAARDAHAVTRIFLAKGRPQDHPLIVHHADAEAALAWAAEVPERARALAKAFWPGPMTLVLARAPFVLDAVTGGQPTVGLRVPDHPVAQALLRAFGDGVAAPSANRFGRISPTDAAHVRAELGERVDVILEGGRSRVGLESTIIDLSGERPRLLRPGGISRAEVAAVLGEEVLLVERALPATRIDATLDSAGAGGDVRAPGMLAAHYAPRAPMRLLPAAKLEGEAARLLVRPRGKVAVIALHAPDSGLVASFGESEGSPLLWRVLPSTPAGAAHELYALLREADAGNPAAILVEAPPEDEAWLAVRDRLRRAETGSGPEASSNAP